MSKVFRDLLKKVGSGTHTGQDLTRQEAAQATRMMLLQEATPAQIGAFMIAHRIKRPTGEELAGMLDAYDEIGPRLEAIPSDRPVMVLCSPYDGRDRTTSLSPLTALVLATAGCSVILHGGVRMPTKEGVPLVDVWQGLGVDWTTQSLAQVQQTLAETGIGFVYLPTHFPQAQDLVPYREQIGKRPPFATVELMWSPYLGDQHVVTGFVHPPTETRAQEVFALRGIYHFTTVKGLEGSCDLPRERTAIVGAGDNNLENHSSSPIPHPPSFIRLHLHPRDYSFAGANVPLVSTAETAEMMMAVLRGEASELTQSVIWNSGFYLWRWGVGQDLEEAIAIAKDLLEQGSVLQKLQQLQQAIKPIHYSGFIQKA